MKTKVLQGLNRYLITVPIIMVMSVLLNACTFDLNNILGVRKDTVKPAAPPSAVRITYNGNGHDNGTAPADEHEYNTGEMAMIMDNPGGLALTGHTFAGWNTKPDGSGTVYRASRRTPQGFTLGDKDLTLYAVWSKDFYIKAGEIYTGQITGSAVHIDAGGVWEVKGNSTLMYLDAGDLAFDGSKLVTVSVKSNGYSIYYDEDQAQNGLLGRRTYELPGGGKLMPKLPHDVETSMNAVHYIDGTAKGYVNEKISIENNFLNRSAVLVKNGGVATIEHSAITSSSSNVPMDVSYDPAARWGPGSALYSCMAGVLVADDVKITVKDGASAGACALYLGFLKLTNSAITCNDWAGRSNGVQASYGGRIDMENVVFETSTETGSLFIAGPGGGSIRTKNVTGVAHGKGSACINSYEYGEIVVQGSSLKSEDESVVLIGAKGEVTVKDSTLTSNTIAVRILADIERFRASGTGAFTNTKIISGGDAFYFNGQSADITVQDGTVIEFPKDCKLIRADSKRIGDQGSKKRPEPINASFTAAKVELQGDVKVAEDGTIFKFALQEGTTYKGAIFGASVSIDDSSEWTVTETCIIAGIDSLSASHITCPKGMRVYYDASINDVGTVKLNGGGELAPIQES
jgi:hypothetical protein